MQYKWWQNTVFYQIYPRSFSDSNGDGIGDIRGIVDKLDYIKWLGAGAIWLSPVYDSPQKDMGYDIRDYQKIFREYGTMEDFDLLLAEMHKRGLRLVMDVVVNHTSDEHPWFRASRRSKDDPHRDFYYWRPGRGQAPPNNWSSFFTPCAWKYDQTTDEWYLHMFGENQPDLNWENPAVRDEIYKKINWWFDRGIDGIRIDVVSLFAKNTRFPDASLRTPNYDGHVFPIEHIAFQPKLADYLREMHARCLAGRDCVSIGEATFVTTDNANSIVGGDLLDMVFQFDLMELGNGEEKWEPHPYDIPAFKETVIAWQKAMDWNALFWGNHDQPRAVSRFPWQTPALRDRCAKMLAGVLYCLRGTPFLFQGEELGMTNYPFSDESELRDIESLAFLHYEQAHQNAEYAWRGIRSKGRDNARTPMQWTGGPQAGFTTGTPWIPVNPNYRELNAEQQARQPDSVLCFYRQLLALRARSDALLQGSFCPLPTEAPQVFAYERRTGGQTVLVVANMGDTPCAVEPGAPWRGAALLLSNMPQQEENTLAPYELRILQRVAGQPPEKAPRGEARGL